MLDIRLTLFWTKAVDVSTTPRFIDRANERLAKLDLRLDVYPSKTANAQHTLDWDKVIDCNTRQDLPDGVIEIFGVDAARQLRGLGHKAFQDTRPRLPVFFAHLKGANGFTFPTTGWWRWVAVDPRYDGYDLMAVAHEMGHAAGLRHPPFSQLTDVTNKNIMSYGHDRDQFDAKQLTALRNSYFVNGGPPAPGWDKYDGA